MSLAMYEIDWREPLGKVRKIIDEGKGGVVEIKGSKNYSGINAFLKLIRQEFRNHKGDGWKHFQYSPDNEHTRYDLGQLESALSISDGSNKQEAVNIFSDNTGLSQNNSCRDITVNLNGSKQSVRDRIDGVVNCIDGLLQAGGRIGFFVDNAGEMIGRACYFNCLVGNVFYAHNVERLIDKGCIFFIAFFTDNSSDISHDFELLERIELQDVLSESDKESAIIDVIRCLQREEPSLNGDIEKARTISCALLAQSEFRPAQIHSAIPVALKNLKWTLSQLAPVGAPL